MHVPVIDISRFNSSDPAERAAAAQEWDLAFSTLGFAIISGHGIPEALLDAVYKFGRAFFEQPIESKLRVLGPEGGIGFEAIGAASVGRTRGEQIPPDLVEAFGVRNLLWEKESGVSFGNLWPEAPLGFRETMEAYITAGHALGQRLMHLSAAALDLPDGFFEPYCARMTHNLRLAYYPDQPTPPLEGQLRNGPHTDFTGFTILRQDDAPGGLQILGPQGTWIDAPPVPGTLIVNCGDLLQRWTNDRWRSNVHRVVNPDRSLTGSTARLSIVVFTGPDPEAEIACLPSCISDARPALYEPILTKDHFDLRMRQTYG